MREKRVRVESYAGYQADERPLRILLDDQRIEVTAVEDRWYSPGSTYFRVLLSNGERYVLRRQEAQDVWTLAAFRARERPLSQRGRCVDTKINSGV
jgi:hypothetical protein